MTVAMNKTVDVSFLAYLQLVAKKSAHEERNSKISIQSKYTVYTHEVVMQSRVLSSMYTSLVDQQYWQEFINCFKFQDRMLYLDVFEVPFSCLANSSPVIE